MFCFCLKNFYFSKKSFRENLKNFQIFKIFFQNQGKIFQKSKFFYIFGRFFEFLTKFLIFDKIQGY